MAASGPPQVSFPTGAGCPPSASGVSSQQASPRPGPASPAQEGRRQGRHSPATIHLPTGLLNSAGKPSRPFVRPSFPTSAPCFPELGPIRNGSLPTLARRAQEAVTPRRLQRRSSRHLVWRRSRSRRHAERLGRREGEDSGGRGRGQSSRVSSARRRHRGRRHSGLPPRLK